jgi:hypothetical protein
VRRETHYQVQQRNDAAIFGEAYNELFHPYRGRRDKELIFDQSALRRLGLVHFFYSDSVLYTDAANMRAAKAQGPAEKDRQGSGSTLHRVRREPTRAFRSQVTVCCCVEHGGRQPWMKATVAPNAACSVTNSRGAVHLNSMSQRFTTPQHNSMRSSRELHLNKYSTRADS